MDHLALADPDGATAHTSGVSTLAPGVRLLGEYQGSGFTEPHYLIVRGDGQVLHVSRLLFLVAAAVDGSSSDTEVAGRVSAEYGRTLTGEGVAYLLDVKLRPMGVVADRTPEGTETEPSPARTLPRANPLLALRFRGTVLPARATRALARLLAPMFFPPTVGLAVISLVGVDVWLTTQSSIVGALGSVIVDPPLLLAVLGILLASTLFHELGHAAACAAGGARPGVIGVAVYVVYPAFFTDVTDSYRLGRAGRVRTDLGGVYFNALSIVVLCLVWAETRSPAVLLAIVLVHVEMLQQLLPLGRLDGYFILADLVGIPDLFGRITPILISLLPWRPAHPKVVELRHSARVVVTVWVLTVVPVMAALLALMLWTAPTIAVQTAGSMTTQWSALRVALAGGDAAAAGLAALSLVLLPLPLVGMVWLVGGAGRRLGATVHRTIRSRRARARAPSTPLHPQFRPQFRPQTDPTSTQETTMSAAPSALAERPAPLAPLTPLAPPPPTVMTSVGGARGRRGRRQRLDRLRAETATRFDGSRRVVVLSRKGGVGKTTTALMLGHTLALHRGDRVVALDANPDAGSLGMRLSRDTACTATDLLAERSWVQRYSQLRTFTSQDPRTRLEVVAADGDPRLTYALRREDYAHLIDLLNRHFTLLVVDTGTGVLDDAIQGVLEEADRLVVVVPPAPDGARVAAMTLDWLDEHGHEALAATSVAVVNAVRNPAAGSLAQVEAHFRRRCASVLRIPWDPILASTAEVSLTDLRPATQEAYLELAAAVGAGFPSTTRATRSGFVIAL